LLNPDSAANDIFFERDCVVRSILGENSTLKDIRPFSACNYSLVLINDEGLSIDEIIEEIVKL